MQVAGTNNHYPVVHDLCEVMRARKPTYLMREAPPTVRTELYSVPLILIDPRIFSCTNHAHELPLSNTSGNPLVRANEPHADGKFIFCYLKDFWINQDQWDGIQFCPYRRGSILISKRTGRGTGLFPACTNYPSREEGGDGFIIYRVI